MENKDIKLSKVYSKEYYKEQFLKRKMVNSLSDCTERQRQILDKEDQKIWDLYVWNL